MYLRYTKIYLRKNIDITYFVGVQDEDGIIGADFTEEPGNDSGCTAVVALMAGTRLIVANAGDSR